MALLARLHNRHGSGCTVVRHPDMAAMLGVAEQPDFSHGTPPESSIPQYVHHLYNITHSLVVFLFLFIVVWALVKRPVWERVLKQDTRLTGTKYLWLLRPKHMTSAQRAAFRAVQRADLNVVRAWMLKEQFQRFWTYTYPGAAMTFFARWFWRATHSRLRPRWPRSRR
jgi:hypothetical protein